MGGQQKRLRNLEHFYASEFEPIRYRVHSASITAGHFESGSKDHIQANHQMTPDTIGMLFAIFARTAGWRRRHSDF